MERQSRLKKGANKQWPGVGGIVGFLFMIGGVWGENFHFGRRLLKEQALGSNGGRDYMRFYK